MNYYMQVFGVRAQYMTATKNVFRNILVPGKCLRSDILSDQFVLKY